MSTKRVTGQGRFADDLRPSGLLHVAVTRCPHPHARVLSIDASAARGLPGVVLVLGPEDAPEILRAHPRYVGDRVALVAAEDPELAARAADAMRIAYAEQPATLTHEEALRPGAPTVLEGATNLAAEVQSEAGDVDGAFASAERVLETTYRLARFPLGPLEPPVALTWLDEDRRLLVRSSTEAPHRVRGRLAECLHIPAARIHMETPLLGGGFGAKSDLLLEDLCALVTLRTGRPARLSLSRGQALALAPALPAETVTVRSALREGGLLALDLAVLLDAGAAGASEERLRSAVRNALAPYRLVHFRFHGRAVHTHRAPPAAVTGGGVAFAVESHLDEVAAALGLDPLELRLSLLRRAGEGEPGREATHEDVLHTVLSVGARAIGWSRRWKASAGPGPKRRGMGLALARRDGAGGPRAVAALQLGEDGSLSLVLGPTARDAGAESVLCRLAAQVVGARDEEVVPATGEAEFALAEAEGGTPALALSASGVEEAARRLRAAMIEVGARLLGVPTRELTTGSGAIRGPGGRALPFAEVGRECLRSGAPLVARASLEPADLPPASAAFFAEVETDTETGQMRVVRLVGALGCGPPAEAALVEARVQGEVLRALGHALGGSLPDPVLTAIDAPETQILFVPADAPITPFGNTSTGDLARRAVAAALANAVAQAGPRVRDVPLTPVALLAGIDALP